MSRRALCILQHLEENLFGFFSLVLHRQEGRGLVRAVTEGLFGTQATLAPEISLAGFDVERVGIPLGNGGGVVHGSLSAWFYLD